MVSVLVAWSSWWCSCYCSAVVCEAVVLVALLGMPLLPTTISYPLPSVTVGLPAGAVPLDFITPKLYYMLTAH